MARYFFTQFGGEFGMVCLNINYMVYINSLWNSGNSKTVTAILLSSWNRDTESPHGCWLGETRDRENSAFKIWAPNWKSQGQIFQIEWVACLWVNFWNMTHMQKSPEKYVLLTFHVEIILYFQKSYKGVQSSHLPFTWRPLIPFYTVTV